MKSQNKQLRGKGILFFLAFFFLATLEICSLGCLAYTAEK